MDYKENAFAEPRPQSTIKLALAPYNLPPPPSPRKIHKVNSVSELVNKFQGEAAKHAVKPLGESNRGGRPAKPAPKIPYKEAHKEGVYIKQDQPIQIKQNHTQKQDIQSKHASSKPAPKTPSQRQLQSPDLRLLHDSLLEQYASKHMELMEHQRAVERVKFEMLELLTQIEECKRNQHLISNSANTDIYRQVHSETSTELNRITSPREEFDLIPAINTLTRRASNMILNGPKVVDLKSRASAIFTPLNSGPPEIFDKTSKFFSEVVTTLSPKKGGSPLKARYDAVDSSFDFDNLRDELDHLEIELVDIDDYDSEDEEVFGKSLGTY